MNSSVISTYYIILVNYALFTLNYFLPLNGLMLNHGDPSYHQFITSVFMHANFTHISGNMFFLYFFGKLIEERIGSKLFTMLYILTGILTNIVEFLLNMGSDFFSLGASGAVFGLFSISLLLNNRKVWKDWVEILVLGPFVISYMITELNSLGQDDSVSHSAHLVGGAIGPILFKLFKRK